MVSTGLGVIGDIGKKTYNALMVDDDEEQPTSMEMKKVTDLLFLSICLIV